VRQAMRLNPGEDRHQIALREIRERRRCYDELSTEPGKQAAAI
jgi:hypothetical protein